ncbi:MAG: hypothetical protein ACLUE1_08160 [Adlercreutzia equolifaciens]
MKDTSSFLDLALDDSMGFDPLGAFDNDVDDDAEEVTEGYLGTPHTDDPTPVVDTRPASERIADLFSAMAPRRRTLLGMITFCAAPQTTDALDAEVDRLQTDNFSVYSPASLANLLERAGALARVTADGEPYPEGDPEPVLVEVDGVSYYEAGEAPEVCWLATEDGAAYAEADKPLDRLTNLLAEDAKYATIYERILGLTAQDAGASMPTINEAVDNDELLKSPRLYAPHFIDKLEKCDAVEWRDKSWRITEVGRAGQRIVADLVAAHTRARAQPIKPPRRPVARAFTASLRHLRAPARLIEAERFHDRHCNHRRRSNFAAEEATTWPHSPTHGPALGRLPPARSPIAWSGRGLAELKAMRFPPPREHRRGRRLRAIATYLSGADAHAITDLAVDYVRAFMPRHAFSAAYLRVGVRAQAPRDGRPATVLGYRSEGRTSCPAGRSPRITSRWNWSSWPCSATAS